MSYRYIRIPHRSLPAFIALVIVIALLPDGRIDAGSIEQASLTPKFTSDWLVNDDSLIGCPQESPDIAAMPGGGFAVTWLDWSSSVGALYLQLYDSLGTATSNRISVTDEHMGTGEPYIAADERGRIVVAWRHRAYGDWDSIHVQLFDSSGTKEGTNIFIDSSGNLSRPAVDLDSTGGFVVTWADLHTNSGVYARMFNSDGTPKGTRIVVNDEPDIGELYWADIYVAPAGDFVITWPDDRDGHWWHYEVYARRFDSGGNPLGPSFRIGEDYGSPLPVIAGGDAGNFAISWRNGNIYARSYNGFGNPHDTVMTVGVTQSLLYAPIDIVYNWGSYIICWSDSSDSGYDVYGRTFSAAGPHEVPLRVSYGARSLDQRGPVIALLPQDYYDALIAWEDSRSLQPDIYAQRLDPETSMIGSNFLLIDDPLECGVSQWEADLSGTDNGGFVAVWKDERNFNSDIYAQLLDADGLPVGSNFRIDDDDSGSEQRKPSVSMDSSGNFIVSWIDSRSGSGEVFARKFDHLGLPMGDSYLIAGGGGAEVRSPCVAAETTGRFAAVWVELYSDWSSDVLVRWYDQSGLPIGSEIVVNDTSGSTILCFEPDVAFNVDGSCSIVWSDSRAEYPLGVYLQRYDSDRNPIGGNVAVSLPLHGNDGRTYPCLAYTASGGLVVVWEDSRDTGPWHRDLYGQILDSSGDPLGAEFKVNHWTSFALCGSPSVVSDSMGEFVVAWYECRDDNCDIRARRYDSDGVPKGPSFIVNSSVSAEYSQKVTTVARSLDKLCYVWADNRNDYNWDIYAGSSDWSFAGYTCGDADGSSGIDIDDVVFLINYIFTGGPAPDPLESGDADCSGAIDIDDVVYLINYIFTGGNAPCDPDGDEIPDC